MKKSTQRTSVKLGVLAYLLVVTGILIVANACNKSRQGIAAGTPQSCEAAAPVELQQNQLQSKVVSIADISPMQDGSSSVAFRELAEAFTVADGAILNTLKSARAANRPVKVTFNPWGGSIAEVAPVTAAERMSVASKEVIRGAGASYFYDVATTDPNVINNSAGLGVINTTSPSTGLTDVVPDMATAQLMFDYIAHQSCTVPGPYGVDHCITFQYCEDGCYARAHKMCYVINNRYRYATHKVFSFAYPSGTYTLSVKAEKWGGCCIRWWYHVAPLVNINTPSGVKAFVFDPAMFDQPVLLATWLHAQQNPACAGSKVPKVTSYKIQPTTSYSPYDTATFDTDPVYFDTNNTLVSYHSLISCP